MLASLKAFELDIYYPSTSSTGAFGQKVSRTPALFFIYGGDFFDDDRVVLAPNAVGYGNIGAFFANRGFMTVIPDYRPLTEVRFPALAEDIRDAILWIVQNSHLLHCAADTNRLLLLGHAAGAAHVATLLLHPELLLSTTLAPRIKGLVLSAGAYHFHPHGPAIASTELLAHYYGGWEAMRHREALGLLARAPAETVQSLPAVLMVEPDGEPEGLKNVGADFCHALERRLYDFGGGESGWMTVERVVARGHNHLSPIFALGTGVGEEWAERVVQWLREKQAVESPIQAAASY